MTDEQIHAAAPPWYRRDTVGIEFGPTGCTVSDFNFMRKMNGADIVSKALEANCEYLILFSKDCDYTYYHSKYRPSPPSLEGRDLLREVMDAAAGKPLHILAYACAQYDSYARKHHPGWELIGQNGQGLGRLCLRHPGYLEDMKLICEELLSYGIDGLHIDMLDLGFDTVNMGCWCELCKSEFRRIYGYEMPPEFDMDDPDFGDFMDFRYTNCHDFAGQLYTHIKKVNPNASVDFNYHGAPPFSYEVAQRPVQQAKFGDFLTAESLPWIFGYNNPSLMSHFLQGVNTEIPYQIVSSRSVFNYHEYTLRPTEDIRWEVMTSIANGATFTMVDKAGYDGWFDPNVYKRLASVFAEAREKSDYSRGLGRIPRCAVYYSHRTRDWVHRGNSAEYENAVAGIAHMLVQEKINYAFLFDENITAARLAEFPLVILPNTGIITPREAELLRGYVGNGGNIIATGPCGIYGEHGEAAGAGNCILDDVLGVKYTGILNESSDTYIVFPDIPPEEYAGVTRGFEDGYTLYIREKLWGYQPAGAVSYAQSYIGYRPGRVDNLDNINSDVWYQLMSPGIKCGGGLFFNRFGKGRAVLIPTLPEKAYVGSHRSPELRKLMANLVGLLTPAPIVDCAKLPVNTECVLTRDDGNGRLIVHLITYNPTTPVANCVFSNDRRAYPPLMEDSALYNGILKVNTAFKRAYSPNGTEIQVDHDLISFRTDRVYEIIVIEL